MNRWYPVVLFAVVGWLANSAFAQGPYGPPPGMLPGPPQPEMFHGYGAQGYAPYGQMPHDWAPQAYGPAYSPQLVPDAYDQWWGRTPAPHGGNPLEGVWLRAEYILWDIQGPGNTLLGAPMASIDPNSVFNTNRTGLVAVVPNLGGTFLRNSNGVINQANLQGINDSNTPLFPLTDRANQNQLNGARIAAGLPVGDGQFELEAWALQESQSSIAMQPTPLTFTPLGTVAVPALTLLRNGLPADDSFILFSEGYQAVLSSNLWGTEANYLLPTAIRGSAIELFPMLGFRYSRFGEKLSISGADIPDPINDPANVLNHRIHASMSNHVFGPQVGLRAELKTGWVTFLFEPKVAASVNRVSQDLSTREIFASETDPDEPEAPRQLGDHFTEFSPVLDLAVMAKVHITPNFTLNVGYDYMLQGSVYRAFDNILYNSSATAGDPPAIGLQKNRSNMYVHGVMVGGEWVFR